MATKKTKAATSSATKSPTKPTRDASRWLDVGSAEELAKLDLQQIVVGNLRLALSHKDGVFGAINGACNHAGGPLGKGHLEGDFVVCPWHQWRFHRVGGQGERGFEEDVVPAHHVRVRDGRVEVDEKPHKQRARKPHAPHPLARTPRRSAGKPRVVGISTTAMSRDYPRFSTSEALLESALAHAAARGHETQLIKLRDLDFRACEGFYSKAARACTWPCSITQMDPNDQLDRVYEALVHWGDVFLVATPIRWGNASALYYKMVERMNCIQNQVTIANKVLIRDKVVGAIITGGQDNVQGVAGQVLGFFAELGFHFPQFPYIAHSRGWSAEDMERNVAVVAGSEELREASGELVDRCLELSTRLLHTHEHEAAASSLGRGGRKGHALPVLND